MHFIIQKNLIKNQTPYIEALNDLNIKYTLVDFEPNLEFISTLPENEDLWFFGSVGFITALRKEKKLAKYIMYNEKKFLFSTLKEQYRDFLLNYEAEIVSLKNAKIIGMKKFIRPNKGLKIFPGTILNDSELRRFQEDVKDQKFSFDSEEFIVVASKKYIKKEYRVFIVNKEIVTGCQYMVEGKIELSTDFPQSVRDFVLKVNQLWTPADSFVIDIAQVYNDEYKVIEVNCINSAGPYLANMTDVVRKIIKLV